MTTYRGSPVEADEKTNDPSRWGTCPVCDLPITLDWLKAAGGCAMHRQRCYCSGECGAAEHVTFEEFSRLVFGHWPLAPRRRSAA